MAVGGHILKRQFLCLFAQEHPDFRLPELQAIISLLSVDVTFRQEDYSNKSPFLVINIPSEEDALKIIDRSVLIRYMYELVGKGSTYEELRRNLEGLPSHVMEPYSKTDYTFSVRVKGFNKKLSQRYQKDTIEWLSFLPICGKVNLKSPDHEFHMLEDYGDNPNTAPDKPLQVFFGRLLGSGQRHLIHQYSLKTRHFIGNTSMDAQLSLIMANMAKITCGSLVYDPFAGTGSILVACAHYGAYVLGSDIDWTIVHGRGRSSRSECQKKWRARDEHVLGNLQQYSLDHCYVDMLVNDASRCVWRGEELFDAIITDPPYGIREGLRKTEDCDDDKENTLDEVSSTIPPLIESGRRNKYTLSSVISDLLEFASRFLVIGGRLVYWLPFIEKDYNPHIVPAHPALTLIFVSEQPITNTFSRRLVTMEKSAPFDPSSVNNLITDTSKLELLHFDCFRQKYFKKH